MNGAPAPAHLELEALRLKLPRTGTHLSDKCAKAKWQVFCLQRAPPHSSLMVDSEQLLADFVFWTAKQTKTNGQVYSANTVKSWVRGVRSLYQMQREKGIVLGKLINQRSPHWTPAPL